MEHLNLDFSNSEKVYSIVSKATLRSNILEGVSEHKEIDKNSYTYFIEQQLRGEKSVWGQMQKCNLETFKSMSKVVKTKVQEKVIELKEEKSLILR